MTISSAETSSTTPASVARTTSPASTAARNSTPVPTSGASERSSRSEEHTSELQSRRDIVCRLLLEKKKLDRIKYVINIDLDFCREFFERRQRQLMQHFFIRLSICDYFPRYRMRFAKRNAFSCKIIG